MERKAPDAGKYIENEFGDRIWCLSIGADRSDTGNTPLLVVHGGPGLSHHYLLGLSDLATHRPVYFYDQLECGNSDRPLRQDNWTLDYYVSELETVREALGLDDDIYLLGHSWGGTVVANHAARQPVGLRGLALASPFISEPRWRRDQSMLRRRLAPDIYETLDSHESDGTVDSAGYLAAVETYSNEYFCRLKPWPAQLSKSFEIINQKQFEVMWGSTDFRATGSLNGYDCSAALRNISAPTLYVCGEFDQGTPAACAEWAKLTPDARLSVIPAASHCLHLDQRECFMEVVNQFLAALD